MRKICQSGQTKCSYKQCSYKKKSVYSDWFHVATPTGVRQGGDLLPDFSGLYVDNLFVILQACRIRCYYVATFAATLTYADDHVVLAYTIDGTF